MSITAAQKHSIDACLCLNETGKLPSTASYSTITVLTDGAGFSYGKHQSTDKSGSLDAIVTRYLDLKGSLATQIFPYLDELASNASTKLDPKNLPQWAKDFEALLKQAGQDPIMQAAQDQIFDENYWTPAVNKCSAMKLVTGLAHLLVYDTCIQSGPGRVDSLRQKFTASPPSGGGEEHEWCKQFNAARRAFLLGNSNPLVQKSVYRVEALQGLIDAGNWELVTPFKFRGQTVA